MCFFRLMSSFSEYCIAMETAAKHHGNSLHGWWSGMHVPASAPTSGCDIITDPVWEAVPPDTPPFGATPLYTG